MATSGMSRSQFRPADDAGLRTGKHQGSIVEFPARRKDWKLRAYGATVSAGWPCCFADRYEVEPGTGKGAPLCTHIATDAFVIERNEFCSNGHGTYSRYVYRHLPR